MHHQIINVIYIYINLIYILKYIHLRGRNNDECGIVGMSPSGILP